MTLWFIRLRSKRATSEKGPSRPTFLLFFPVSMSILTDCFYRGTNAEMTKQQLCLVHQDKYPVIVTITPLFIYRLFQDAVAVAKIVWRLIMK